MCLVVTPTCRYEQTIYRNGYVKVHCMLFRLFNSASLKANTI